jgi:hypothetical protein
VIRLDIDTGTGSRRVSLADYLDAGAEERAHDQEYRWIKTLRSITVGGTAFRSRFTFRGDSLWWFAELYLHKEQAILNVHRALAAFDALIEREQPRAIRYVAGANAGIIAHAAARRRVAYSGPSWPSSSRAVLARMDVRARALAAASHVSRIRATPIPVARARIAAFVHRAFWRAEGPDGSGESYIGPVLRALESRVSAGDLRYIGVGPRTNFRARRWWDPIAGAARTDPAGVMPIERYAPAAALQESRRLYRDRHETRRQLWASDELRAHAVIEGCDCWPLVRHQLAGIALLQFPWSARAMDEVAAALAATEPAVAVTYAEAGGWGRALALECRRRGVPLAGLQHGFIYRHWLNYRHEPDEIAPDAGNPEDRGFPLPSSTLVFDEYAATHLRTAGHFPEASLTVTGSPRLDDLLAAIGTIDEADIARVRRETGAVNGRGLVLFAAKEREARGVLPQLIRAVATMDDLQLVVKPHPAETADVYTSVVGAAPNVRVVEPSAPLPALLAAARAIVTVNSTVAIDAMAIGVPSLVIGLPNNLSPFVERGLMLGAGSAEEIRASLLKLLYDQEFPKRLVRGAVGRAAARSADAILALARDGESKCAC